MSSLKVITIIWYMILLVVTGILFAEYRYFQKQSQEIEQKKDDYTGYFLALQKMMAEYEVLKGELEVKKKSIYTSEMKNEIPKDQLESFLVVNRELDYLKKSALIFARANSLYDLLSKLYDGEEHKINYTHKSSKPFIKSSNNQVRSYAKNDLCHHQRWKKLQKEPVFRWPLDKSKCWVSSLFGKRKKQDGTWGFHYGVDMSAPKGTPIYAPDKGTVIEAHYVRGYGNTILIKHNHKFKTRYAHLDKILVGVGEKVKLGQIIGKVGETGFIRKRGKDGSHLHFEVHHYNKRVNPFYFLA